MESLRSALSLLVILWFVLVGAVLSGSSVLAREEPRRDEIRGVVVDAKPPVTVDGVRKNEEVSLRVKLEPKGLCLEEVYLEDGDANVLVPYRVLQPTTSSFGFGIGIGIGGGTGSRTDAPKELYRGDPKESYIPNQKRGAGAGGVGAGVGVAMPVFDILRGKECQTEVEAHFALPKGRERIEQWKVVLAVVNPRTKEELVTPYNLAESDQKIRASD